MVLEQPIQSSQTQGRELTIESLRDKLFALKPSSEQLWEILKDDFYRYSKDICVIICEELMRRHGTDLTNSQLSNIMYHASGTKLAIDAGEIILGRENTNDDLGQMVIGKTELAARAARIILDRNPARHELFRSLSIPEVRYEAFAKLLSLKLRDRELTYIWLNHSELRETINQYTASHGPSIPVGVTEVLNELQSLTTNKS